MTPGRRLAAFLAAPLLLALAPGAAAQTFQRPGLSGSSLGVVLPPDQQDFLPGQFFDLRLEVHAPVNGSEAFADGVPDAAFTATIAQDGAPPQDLAAFFGVAEAPPLETWSFTWFEDLYAEDAGTPALVNVASRVYRRLALYEPGAYTVTLHFYDGQTTTAEWLVRPLATEKKAKNVILFIGAWRPGRGRTAFLADPGEQATA